MRYYVETTEPVLDYIRQVDGLTPDDQLAVLDGIEVELSRDADHFLDLRPLAHESLSFRYDYFHPTRHTFFHFDFIVDASSLEMGVVRVVYVECTTEPMT